jgi:dihydroorotase
LALALVADGHLTLGQVIALLTVKPATVMGLDRGTLRTGAPADITIIDPNAEWVVDPAKFRSKSRNTPFSGWKMRGRVVKTLVSGKVVYDATA